MFKEKGRWIFSGYCQLEYKELQKLLKKTLGGGILQVAFQLEYKKVTKIIGKEVRRREFPPGYFVNLNIKGYKNY